MAEKRVVPWVHEADYEALTRVCLGVPDNFADWLQLRLDEVAKLEAIGVACEKVIIDPRKFAAYCRECGYDKGNLVLLGAFAVAFHVQNR